MRRSYHDVRYPRPFAVSLRDFFKGPMGIALAVIVLLGIIAFFFRAPLSKATNGWRAGQLAEEAATFAERGEWAQASGAALASLQLDLSTDAFRTFYQSARKLQNPQALRIGGMLFLQDGATSADRAEVLGHFIAANDLLATERLVAELTEEDLAHPGVRAEVMRFLMRTGRFGEALEMDKATPGDQQNTADLIIAEELVRSRRTEYRNAVASRLRRVISGAQEEDAFSAVRLLASLPDDWIAGSVASLVLEKFGAREEIPADIMLAVRALEIGLHPDRRESILQGAVADWDSNKELVAAWLLRVGEAEKLIALTNPDALDGEESPPLPAGLFELRMQALEATGDFETLYGELAEAPAAIPASRIAARRAVAAEKTGRKAEAVSLWLSAHDTAGRELNRNNFYDLAEIAKSSGSSDNRFRALATALEHPVGIPPATAELKDVFDWLYQKGETDSLLKVSAVLLDRLPQNPVLINNYFYLLALRGYPGERAETVLQHLVKKFPNEPQYAGTLALALVRNEKHMEAIAVFEALSADPQVWPAAEKAVFSVALHAIGASERAADLEKSIDWEQLSEPESKVFQALIEEAKAQE
ncbi:MAG: hypothetical protein AAGJ79_02310 [Verrucomicrobiota bacterium]